VSRPIDPSLRFTDGGRSVEVVLFDLGGVLVELRGVADMRNLVGAGSDEELWQRWLTCPWVRTFESGRCSELDFARGIVEEWALSITAAAYLERFRAWPTGPLPGAEELVDEVARRVRVGCFSNTNAVHFQEHFRHWPLMARFDDRFLSHELGVLKPDRVAFERVARALAVPGNRILFLDDNHLNVEGARSAGFMARRVQGVSEARTALVAAGILTPADPG
jgi:HAD superfamily hydrolase (TIGR01509 family)